MSNIETSVETKEKTVGLRAESNKAKESKKSPIKILVFILLPICALYFGGVALFNNVFLPNTTFDGKNFSFKTPVAIAEAMTEETNSRTLVLKEIDGEETLDLSEDIGFVKSAVEPSDGWINKQAAWVWPKYLFSENNLSGQVDVKYDETKFNQAIDGLKAMDESKMRKPTDAYLGRKGDAYEIVPEDNGNEIIRDKLVQAVKSGIDDNLTELDLDSMGCYTKAKVSRDDPSLTETFNKYKAVNFQRISLDMVGETVTLETPDIIEKFYDGNEISEEKVEEFVSELQAKYNTFGIKRSFKNHFGNTITVGGNEDTYGFLLDWEGTKDIIYTLLKEKKSEDTSPSWTLVALMRDEDGNDIGGTYVEVSVDNQKLWVYEDYNCVFTTDVVTGLVGKYDTPRGVYSILDMKKDTNLKGEIKIKGKVVDKWDTPVDFWMGLTWAGVGIHNAPWRGAYGGDIYKTGGSHGCINVSYEAGEKLYKLLYTGTPVIVW